MSVLPKVPRSPLGSTGLEVSVLGFGASAIGGVFSAVDDDVSRQAVHNAFHAGINYFDTAPFYGATKAESVLGSAISGLPRSEIIIATKVGRYTSGAGTGSGGVFDFSAERVTASVQESLQRLQTDYIDIIQCHDMEFGDLDQIVNETLPALQKLKEQGLVRHIGITGLPFKIFHYVLDRVPKGTVDVVLTYCHNCLNDKSLAAELPYLSSKGVGVINGSPLSMGLLTKGGPPPWHPAPPSLMAACRDATARAETKGVDIAKLALSDVIRTPGVTSTLSGMATPEVVAANVLTTLEAYGLVANAAAVQEQEALAEVRAALASVQDMTWPSGKPENN